MAELSPLRRAKRPRSILAGPYGHPFHALFITIPIGSWIASIVFDIISLVAEEPAAFVVGARWLVGIGIVGAVLAAFFGFLDLSILAKGTNARRMALSHMTLNLVAIAVFAVSFFVRVAAPDDEASIVAFVISIVGLLLVGASGFLGGELAYRLGVRVADEETQLEKGFS
jgi:uncharacterized membrane protein